MSDVQKLKNDGINNAMNEGAAIKTDLNTLDRSRILPNSLMRKPAKIVQWPNGQELLQLYCANCGREGGLVFKVEYEAVQNFAFYLCDPCAEKWSPLANMGVAPDEAFWSKVKECMANDFDHELSALEIVEALKDEHNPLTKLCRDRMSFRT